MMKNHLCYLKSLWACCLLLCAMPLKASETTNKPITHYQDLIVSATLSPVPKEAIGSAVTLITAADIEAKGLIYLADILRTVPGLAVNKSGGFGTLTDIRSRGAEANHTLVLIDGIEVNDPGNFTSGFDAGLLTTDNIERIEILRGAQSALWGSDAIGAVINIITKKGTGAPQLTAGFEYGSFDTQKTTLRASYGDTVFNINLGGAILSTDGINIARGGTEKDAHHHRTYDLKLGLTPTDWIEFAYVHREVSTDTETDPQPSAIIVDSAGNQTMNAQRYQKGTTTIALFDGRWTQKLGIEHIKTTSNTLSSIFAPSFSDGERHKYTYQHDFKFEFDEMLNNRHDVSLLFEYQDDRAQGRFIGGGTEVGFIAKSYAVEYRLGLFNQLFLAIGARHDNNDFFENANTYRATAAYQFDARSRLHLSYGTGIKNPTISELFGNFATFTGNPNLKPETSRSWDIGIEQSLFDAQLLFDITYFNNRISDQITGFVSSFGNTVQNSAGTNHIYGLEYHLTWHIQDDLKFTGNYTLTRADDANGNELVRRAKHIGSANIHYDFLNNKANLNLGVIYNGEQADTIFTSSNRRIRLDDYLIVNLNGRYQLDKMISLYARIENLLAEDYEEIYSYQSPGIGVYAGFTLTLNP